LLTKDSILLSAEMDRINVMEIVAEMELKEYLTKDKMFVSLFNNQMSELQDYLVADNTTRNVFISGIYINELQDLKNLEKQMRINITVTRQKKADVSPELEVYVV
jgi:hypothetical protein